MPILFDALTSTSAVVAYGTAKLLSILSRSERISSHQRKTILEQLANVLESPTKPYQGVYIFQGHGKEDDPVVIHNIIRLDRGFYQALLEVSGML